MVIENNNIERINALRNIIAANLDPLIDQDYCLLDIPDHNNIGDSLIWAGELAYLKKFNHKSLYTANCFLCQFDQIPDRGLILLHGGGNFGDVWREQQDFRLKAISKFKDSRIVVFPQTVHYKDKNLLIQDAIEFNKHPNLTICARDTVSYEILKAHFTNNTILLVPDMAFCLDFSKDIKTNTTGKLLYLRRKDKELQTGKKDAVVLELIKSKYGNAPIDTKDWPTIDGVSDQFYRWYYRIDGFLSKRLIKTPVFGGLIDHRYGIKRRDSMENHLKIGVSFINKYDELYSTRLHVFILGTLLNKPVNILDNSYGKNLNFYNTWLTEFSNVKMIK